MKAISKPLSSPSRNEKLPPPLMIRFLRSNVGSRSRGRSRSKSPIFFYNLRSKKSIIEKNQSEPSSPKVTCIGQVRVRRSKGKKRGGGATTNRRRGWWRRMRRSFLCGNVSLRFWNKKKALFRKVCCLSFAACCKKVDASEDSFRVCSSNNNNHRGTSGKNGSFSVNNFGNNNGRVSHGSENGGHHDLMRICDNDNMENDDDECDSCTTIPPKNALLLTRCRSVPYRSGRFCNTALTERNGEDHTVEEDTEQNDARISEESNNGPMENAPMSSSEFNQSKPVHPLLLTRCKSEPARTGLRLIKV